MGETHASQWRRQKGLRLDFFFLFSYAYIPADTRSWLQCLVEFDLLCLISTTATWIISDIIDSFSFYLFSHSRNHICGEYYSRCYLKVGSPLDVAACLFSSSTQSSEPNHGEQCAYIIGDTHVLGLCYVDCGELVLVSQM